jgi:hypothetical protein
MLFVRPSAWFTMMKRGSENVLPQSLAPRGLSREQAAAYVGISPSLFDMLDDRFLETDQGTDDWLADSSFAIV